MASSRKSVLFFCVSDYGYANVVLATTYELIRQNQVDVHIASFSPLEPRIQALTRQAQDEDPDRPLSPITFHNIQLFPGFAAWAAQHKNRNKADVPHPSGRRGAPRTALLTLKALTFMEPEQHISLHDWSADLAKQLDPSLLVIDPILVPIHDMARSTKRKYAVIHPWNVADGLIPQQPWLAAYWKYPAFSTGFNYPVPWHLIPENIYCYLNAKKCRSHPKVKALNQARTARGINNGPLGTFTPWAEHVPQITPSLPEIDLPVNTPSNVFDCGPLLLPSQPIEQSDPELLAWLEQRPTVLISLGTLFEAKAEAIRQQALAIQTLLRERPDVQVLWKLKAESVSEKDGQEQLETILRDEIAQGKVRMQGWLKAEPVAILRSGHIVCAVHHGGANSYYEATWAGVPQVVLAMWYDTFDYGTRVEHLGTGVYGNRDIGRSAVIDPDNYVAPTLIDGKEFAAALLKVVGRTKEGKNPIREKAAKLGEVCRASGGRVTAAKLIHDLCEEA